MLEAITPFTSVLLPSFFSFPSRTCQRSSGFGSDAGAEHSAGVSEQSEGDEVETHTHSTVLLSSSAAGRQCFPRELVCFVIYVNRAIYRMLSCVE